MTLDAWLEKNPPEDMPFWPGARYTEPFGLRRFQSTINAGGSPGHLGVDRAGSNQPLRMPFLGSVEWSLQSTAIGSLLKLSAAETDIEIHVFHTEAPNRIETIDEPLLRKGETLPVKASDLGLSTAVHTHTEVLIPYSDTLKQRCVVDTKPFVEHGSIIPSAVVDHCRVYRLDKEMVLDRLYEQVSAWRIRELWPHFAVREYVWRAAWEGPVAFVDSQFLLRI